MANIGALVYLDNSKVDLSLRFIDQFQYRKEILDNCTLLSSNEIVEDYKVVDGEENSQRFAKIIFDKGKNSLRVYRDCIGAKPIYYFQQKSFIAISSRISELLILLREKQLNQAIAFDFLAFGALEHDEATLIKGIKELPVGKGIKVNLKANSIRYFADIQEENPSVGILNIQDSIVKDINRISKNYEGTSASLSGGIDSSVIALSMNMGGSKPHLYTIGFEGEKFDETTYAQRIAETTENKWTVLTPTGKDYMTDLKNLHSAIELPTLSAGSYLQYYLFQRLKSDGQDVVFDGTGADALFAGHWHHKVALWKELITTFHWMTLLAEWKYEERLVSKIKLFIKSLMKYHGIAFLPKRFIKNYHSRIYDDVKILNKDFIHNYVHRLEEHYDSKLSTLNNRLSEEYYEGVLKKLIRFPDRLSRYFNVEVYFPFVENMELSNYVMSRKSTEKIVRSQSKYLLKQAFKNELPKEIFDRKDKMGLVSPNNKWLNRYKDETRHYFMSGNEDVFDIRYLDKNYSRLFDIESKTENYRMFKYLSFVVWREVFNVN